MIRNIIISVIVFIPLIVKGTDFRDLYFTNVHEDNDLLVTYSDCIAQDNEGFIWFEYNGLSRFDGNSILTYSSVPGESNSLVTNGLNYLLPDGHILWIATQKGLSRFDLDNHRFKNFYEKYPKTIGSQFIRCLCKMDSKHLFIGTNAFGIYILNTVTDSLVHFDSGMPNGISSNTVYKIIKNCDGKYWIATENGLNLYDPVSNSFTYFLKGESIRDIVFDGKKQLWVSGYSNENIVVLDGSSGKLLENYRMPAELKEKQKRLLVDSRDILWIAVLDRGIYMYDHSNDELFEVRNSNSLVPQTIPSPMQIFEDRDKNIWITTFNKGLFYYDRSENPFAIVKNSFRYKDRFANATRYVYKDVDGELWSSAREFAMLSNYNLTAGEFENFLLPSKFGSNPEDDIIWFITDGNKGKLLLGTIHSGLVEFDKKTKQFSAKKYNPANPDQIKSNSIFTQLIDKDGNLWIGYSNDGLDRYDPITDKYTHYDALDKDRQISGDLIRCIFEDKKGILWVGTTNGLNKLNGETGRFESYYSELNNSLTLSDNRINDIFEDSRFILWIATGSGLNRFDRNTGEVKQYSQKDGYAFSNTFKILEDNSGNLWLNGERGLSKFNVLAEEFENFTPRDGLQNSLFFHNGTNLDDGRMVFGGNAGFNVFDPDKIILDEKPLETKLTGFKLFNKPVEIGYNSILKRDITQTDSVVLSYKDEVITIEYGALCFRDADKVEYAYRMDGFEKEWNYVENQRMATYTNLSPGDYVFEVKAAFKKQFDNAVSRKLFISVTPPFWKTWWAFIIYILLLIVGLIYYRIFLLKKQEQLHKKEIEEERLKFFINISHEFRTPLTLMINPLYDVKKNPSITSGVKEKISVAYRSAQKLLQLVTQLQDFRKLDFEPSHLQVQEIEIVDYIGNLTAQFKTLSASKDIDLEFTTGLKTQNVFVDVDKLEKILNNLISNALKYTNKNGKVTISVALVSPENLKSFKELLKSGKGKSVLQIKVEDTGKGMTKEQLGKVFERFYQVDPNNIGAGIGLNFVKSLVEKHHGELLVESEVGVGTTFTVRLPFNKDDYSDFEINKHPDSANVTLNATILDALEYDLQTGVDEEIDADQDQSKKDSILIVEDNKALLLQLKTYLEKTYKVYTAGNGKEGLQKALKHIPDLILSDVMMPVMDGIEMCRKVKESEEICNVPVILLTAKDLVEERIKGYETGADAYMSKPFYMEELEVQIKNIIKGRQRLQDQFKSKSILSDLANENYENKDELFLNKATNIVLENIDKTDFSIKDLCDELGIGNSYLFNKLTKLTGQNPSRFVRAIRLKYSVELMMKQGMSIKEVCYQAGFNSPPYFTKVFNEFYGCSPTEYIKQHKG